MGGFEKQHFEMENINEALEQRIDQLKGQRDVSIMLNQPGFSNEIAAMKIEAKRCQHQLTSHLANLRLSWKDKLVVKMKELNEAMK